VAEFGKREDACRGRAAATVTSRVRVRKAPSSPLSSASTDARPEAVGESLRELHGDAAAVRRAHATPSNPRCEMSSGTSGVDAHGFSAAQAEREASLAVEADTDRRDVTRPSWRTRMGPPFADDGTTASTTEQSADAPAGGEPGPAAARSEWFMVGRSERIRAHPTSLGLNP